MFEPNPIASHIPTKMLRITAKPGNKGVNKFVLASGLLNSKPELLLPAERNKAHASNEVRLRLCLHITRRFTSSSLPRGNLIKSYLLPVCVCLLTLIQGWIIGNKLVQILSESYFILDDYLLNPLRIWMIWFHLHNLPQICAWWSQKRANSGSRPSLYLLTRFHTFFSIN